MENTRVTLRGTAPAQSTIVLKAGNGREIIRTQATIGGDWTATGDFAQGTSRPTFTVTPKTGDAFTRAYELTVAKSGVTQPLDIATPAQGQTVESEDGTVTFSGTGTTGKATTGTTVKIGSASSDYFSVKADTDGDWSGKGFVGFRNAKSLVTVIDPDGTVHTSNLDYTVVQG